VAVPIVSGVETGRGLRRLQSSAAEAPRQERGVMKIGTAFKSSTLKAADIAGQRVVVTIDKVTIEEVGQGDDKEEKPILHFVGKEKGLVLNKTNANTIIEILGTDETNEWKGHRIVLYPDKTDFNGQRVNCIRIAAAPINGTRPAPVEPPVTISDEDVPF
jgi:hypothetical protein